MRVQEQDCHGGDFGANKHPTGEKKLEEEDKNEDENRTKAGDKNKTKTRIMVMAKKYQNKRGPEHNNR